MILLQARADVISGLPSMWDFVDYHPDYRSLEKSSGRAAAPALY